MRAVPRPLVLLCLFLAGAAPALPGVGTADGRTIVDPVAVPWRSLARLQVPGEARCTAVVVGPRTVLTAAHCLWGRRLRRYMPAASVHVLTGYAAGRFARHSLAVGYRLGAERPNGPETDFAVVTLAEPIGDAPLALADSDPAVGTGVVLGGYNQDRAEVIEADLTCAITGHVGGRLLHGCDATHGTSGAPLLARGPDGGWRIVGLQVAAFVGRAGGIAVAPSRLRAALGDDPP